MSSSINLAAFATLMSAFTSLQVGSAEVCSNGCEIAIEVNANERLMWRLNRRIDQSSTVDMAKQRQLLVLKYDGDNEERYSVVTDEFSGVFNLDGSTLDFEIEWTYHADGALMNTGSFDEMIEGIEYEYHGGQIDLGESMKGVLAESYVKGITHTLKYQINSLK